MLNNPVIVGAKLPALTTPASPGDVLIGKQLIDANGNILTGTMPAVEQATPSIGVSSSGLITASATQSEGKVDEGTKTETNQLPTQPGKTITPGTTSKTAVSAGKYTTGEVTVSGDPNLVASNIKSGVSIFGVAGTLSGGIDNLNLLSGNASAISAKSITISVPGLTDPSKVLGVSIWCGKPNAQANDTEAYPATYLNHTFFDNICMLKDRNATYYDFFIQYTAISLANNDGTNTASIIRVGSYGPMDGSWTINISANTIKITITGDLNAFKCPNTKSEWAARVLIAA